MLARGPAVLAQVAPAAAPPAAPAPAAVASETPEAVRLIFPDQVELKLLIDYVASKLKLKILYDEKVAGKRVTLRAEEPVPVGSLLEVLQAAMSYKGLVLKRSAEGWYRVELSADASRQAPLATEGADLAALADHEVATTVIRPKHLSAAKALAAVKPYLSAELGKDAYVPDSGDLVIVTDYAANVRKAEKMLALLDVPGEPQATVTLPVRTMPVAQFQTLLQQHLGEALATASPRPVITIDAANNALVVTAGRTMLDRIAGLQAILDRPPDIPESALAAPVGGLVFYTLRNIDAAEAANTLTQLFGGGTLTTVDEAAAAAARRSSEKPSPEKPASETARQEDVNRINAQQPVADSVRREEILRQAGQIPAMSTFHTAEGPRVTVYPQTNTLIINASREEHERIARILERLDRRRPQVLMEALIVEVTGDNSWSLGVELENANLNPGNDPTSYLVFSAFGLSTIDLATAQRTLLPGGGLNAVILSPDDTKLIVQALATQTNSRVVSAPGVLVNDNATANLQSIREEPFTTVNASETVSTTTFGGYAQAGTQVLVTPHISESNHLRLRYELTLNSFTGAAPSPNSPPPRSTNTVSSEVVVPDGYTVVVGGLVSTTRSTNITKIPLLGDIPLAGLLFQSRTEVDNNRTLYIFLRPVIFRDDAFLDLKHFSDQRREKAEVDQKFPENPLGVWRTPTTGGAERGGAEHD